MKIINLKIENIKRIKAVEIKCDSNFIEITGKNAQGKSSVLDSIAYALGGKALIPEKPVREGAIQAAISLDIGEYVVHRKFTPAGSSLMVVNKNGDVKASPQEFLNKLIGNLSFDPLKFVMMDSKKRTDIFKKILGINTDKLTAEHSALYQKRRDAGGVLERAKTVFNELSLYSDDVEVSDLVELQEARDKAFKHNAHMREMGEKFQFLSNEVEKFKAEIERLNALVFSSNAEINKIFQYLQDNESIDISTFDDQLKNTQELMRQKSKHNEYLSAKAEYEKANESYNFIQKLLESNLMQQKVLMQSVKMPIDGLDLKDNELYFNGIPFEQLSQAEQLTISMSMAIAENPELKIVRIQDGALLDNESLKFLKKINTENGFQCWIETISNEPGKEDALYIEDGELLA